VLDGEGEARKHKGKFRRAYIPLTIHHLLAAFPILRQDFETAPTMTTKLPAAAGMRKETSRIALSLDFSPGYANETFLPKVSLLGLRIFIAEELSLEFSV
jgi:hypothetical protein